MQTEEVRNRIALERAFAFTVSSTMCKLVLDLLLLFRNTLVTHQLSLSQHDKINEQLRLPISHLTTGTEQDSMQAYLTTNK